MNLNRIAIPTLHNHLLTFVFLFAGLSAGVVPAQAELSQTPLPAFSPRQLDWQKIDRALYVCLDRNTFTGPGVSTTTTIEQRQFLPESLDPKQWAKVAKAAGFGRIVFAAKQSDGFCLWPSTTTEFNIGQIAWRGGKGDLLREFCDAITAEGLNAGVFVSIEDHSHPNYGTPEYNEVYLKQLEEVLSNYGPFDEVRFDGAGGFGGGAMGSPDTGAFKKTLEWDKFFELVRRHQPNAVIVSNAGPDVRWNGNNNGHAGEPIWTSFDPASVPGPVIDNVNALKILNVGDPDGSELRLPECFTSLHNEKWWNSDPAGSPMALDKLMNLYLKSVGRGCVLLLHVPLDHQGLISKSDSARLVEWNAELSLVFREDLYLTRSEMGGRELQRDDPPLFRDSTDPDDDCYFFCYPMVLQADGFEPEKNWASVGFEKPQSIAYCALGEPLEKGQRVLAFHVEARLGTEWKRIAEGQSIGRLKILKFSPIQADEVRIVLDQSRALPAWIVVSLFGE